MTRLGRFQFGDMIRSKSDLYRLFKVSRNTFNKHYLPTLIAETSLTAEDWRTVHNGYFNLAQQGELAAFWERWASTVNATPDQQQISVKAAPKAPNALYYS